MELIDKFLTLKESHITPEQIKQEVESFQDFLYDLDEDYGSSLEETLAEYYVFGNTKEERKEHFFNNILTQHDEVSQEEAEHISDLLELYKELTGRELDILFSGVGD